MRAKAITLVAPLAVMAVLGCSSGDTTDIPERERSPFTEIEITPLTNLEELEGLYQDRTRLSSPDAVKHAAEWGMTVDEAKEHVNDLIDFHIVAFWSYQLSEKATAIPATFSKATEYLSGLIAAYVKVAPEQVVADVQAALSGWEDLFSSTRGESGSISADGDCIGDIFFSERTTTITPKIDRRKYPPWFKLVAYAGTQTDGVNARHFTELNVKM